MVGQFLSRKTGLKPQIGKIIGLTVGPKKIRYGEDMIDETTDKQLRAAFNLWLNNGTSMDQTLSLTKSHHNYYLQQKRGAVRFNHIQQLMVDYGYSLRAACYILADDEGISRNTIYRAVLKYMNDR